MTLFSRDGNVYTPVTDAWAYDLPRDRTRWFRKRDNQRAKVYRWEWRMLRCGDAPRIGLGEARELAELVWDMYKPKAYPIPEICVDTSLRTFSHAMPSGKIRLERNMVNRLTVLHELAHVLIPNHRHDEVFASLARNLYRDVLGWEVGWMNENATGLINGRRWRVRFAEPGKFPQRRDKS